MLSSAEHPQEPSRALGGPWRECAQFALSGQDQQPRSQLAGTEWFFMMGQGLVPLKWLQAWVGRLGAPVLVRQECGSNYWTTLMVSIDVGDAVKQLTTERTYTSAIGTFRLRRAEILAHSMCALKVLLVT